MKKSVLMLVTALFFACSTPANAEGPFEKFGAACGEAIERLCPDVELGQGRVLECIEKNKDKVSEECNKAREDAEKQFEDQAAADPDEGPFEKFGAACEDEIDNLCSDVAIGKGGILACLEKNKDKLSERCDRARVSAEKMVKEQQAASDDPGVSPL